jgi:hypothetical protein
MPTLSPDEALEHLRGIRADFNALVASHGKASEADTRVKLVDRVLKEVCGTRPLLCAEAKREGVSFIVPKTLASHKSFALEGALVTDRQAVANS